MPIKKVNCLILDDHPLVCAAIENLLRGHHRIAQVHSLTEPQKAQAFIKDNKVDLLVLDVNLAKADGFEFARRILAHGYKGKMLFISANESQIYSETAFRLGADGYITKSENMNLIVHAIDSILNGYTFFKFTGEVPDRNSEVKLSQREAVVLTYLMEGKANKEIAEILSLSAKTISTYKTRILEKYQVKSVLELMKVGDSIHQA